MSEWLWRDDRWPTHSRGDADRALADLRRQGWWLKPSQRGHSFGLLVCRRNAADGSPEEEQCKFRVHSTAGGDPGDTANLLHQLLERCPHQDNDSRGTTPTAELPDDRAAAAHQHVVRAEKLADALERMVAGRRSMERCRELLEVAEQATDEVDHLLAAAIEAEHEAAQAHTQGRDLTVQAGVPVEPFPPSEVEIITAPARAALDAAVATVGSADDRAATTVHERVEAVRTRLAAARNALDAH